MMLSIIKHNFKYLTIPTFTLLYISMVRSHLDYGIALLFGHPTEKKMKGFEKSAK